MLPEQASYLRNNNAFDGRDPEAAAAARKAVQEPGIAIAGPLPPLYGSHGGRVLVVRRAIFVPASGPNETFSRPNATNPLCGSLCDWNATSGMAFWGFAAGFVDMDSFLDPSNPNLALSNPLSTLDELGLSYTLVTADGVTVAATAKAPRVSVHAEVVLPGTKVRADGVANNPWVVNALGSEQRVWGHICHHLDLSCSRVVGELVLHQPCCI